MFAAGLGPVANTAFGDLDGDHRDPHRREDLQLDGHDVRRRPPVHHAHAVLGRGGDDVRDRRPVGRDARVVPSRLPADRHVLHRGALPLRDLRRRVFGFFGGLYYWWPKVFGAPLGEGLGKVHFWIMLDRVQPDVRADAHPRAAGHDPPRVHVPRVARLTFWNQIATLGRVPDRAVGPGVHRERRRARTSGSSQRGLEDPVGRAHARVDDLVAAARVQLRRDPAGPLARRVLAPQVRGGREDGHAGAGAGGRRPGARRRPRGGRARRSICRARRTGRSSPRSGCPSSAYGVIYSWWLVGAGALRRPGRLLRAGPLEPSVAEDEPMAHRRSSKGRTARRRRRARDHHRACRTPSSRCGCSWPPSACCSAR